MRLASSRQFNKELRGDNMNTLPNSDQTEKRDSKGRFIKGNKPKNGLDKNPQNIAPGGYWRYKEHGKAAIIDIFKMSVEDFNSLEQINNNKKTVLDEVLYTKFKSAMAGNSRDADFLFNQAFGEAPNYKEASSAHYRLYEKAKNDFFNALGEKEVEELLDYLSPSSSKK